MKEFNLDAALNGEPVMLRNGKKAYIGYKTPDYYVSDIVGMWEEPKISIEDLPKPFYPKMGEWFYYVNPLGVVKGTRASNYTGPLYGCFKTEKDAQKWLDFMKSMME